MVADSVTYPHLIISDLPFERSWKMGVINVSKPSRGPSPDDAASNPHHVVTNGVLSGFRNPYASYQVPRFFHLQIFK